jgi:hypothetical protein
MTFAFENKPTFGTRSAVFRYIKKMIKISLVTLEKKTKLI